ncbi:MAG: T9SS type A sorting domain-containing protein [Bacteroidota bacterium]
MTFRLLPFMLALALAASSSAQTTFTSIRGGNWSDPTIWDSGTVPTTGSNIVIEDFDDILLDVNADVNNVAITDNGDLFFSADGAVTLTVRGDITMGSNTRFRPSNSATGSFVRHTLLLEGDLTGIGEVDFRRGSNGSGTSAGIDVTFQGTRNSTVDLTGASTARLLATFSPIGRGNEFNSITFAKTGSGRVILRSSIESSNNNSVGAATCAFNGGVVEVADGQALVCASSISSAVSQGDTGSYVIGTFGRGLGNGGRTTPTFFVGDETQGRPVTIDVDPTGASTPFLLVTLVDGSADALATSFSGDIEKVSELRYYRVQYDDEGEGVDGTLAELQITYAADDGVAGGNSDLRVATSGDGGATWVERGGDSHTTDASGATIESETVSLVLDDEETLLLALGNAVGGANRLTLTPPPVFSAAFAPDVIVAGETATVTFSIDNTGSGLAPTGLDVSTTFPDGLTVAASPAAATTCTGGTLTAASGSATITYTGGSVGPGATCTVSVDVTTAREGTFATTSGELTSSFGSSGTATATLTATPAPAEVSFARVQQVVREGDGSIRLEVQLTGDLDEDETVTVSLADGDPADLGGFESETLVLGPRFPGSVVVEVPLTDDSRRESNEAFIFSLAIEGGDNERFIVGSPAQTAVIVADDDQDSQVVQIAIRDQDGDGVEDGGPRFLALPLSGVSVGEVIEATGAEAALAYRQPVEADETSRVEADEVEATDRLSTGQPLLLDVAPGASLSISGVVPESGVATFGGFAVGPAVGSTGEARVLLPVGNPTTAPVRLGAIEITGGTLADVALVFDVEAGSFRPVSVVDAGDRVIAPFEAVVLQVIPTGDAAAVSAAVPLDGSAAGDGGPIGEAPLATVEGETALMVSLAARDGAATPLVLRFFDGADASASGVDLVSPFGPTLSGVAASDAAAPDAGPSPPFAVLANEPPAPRSSVVIPLAVALPQVVALPPQTFYELSYDVLAAPRPVSVELVDRGAVTRLSPGSAYEFTAGAADSVASAERFALRVTFPGGVATDAPAAAPTVDVYPNPSPGMSTVRVSDVPPGRLRITVYDAVGREAAVLFDAAATAGDVVAPLDAGRLAPGIYLIRVEGNGLSETRSLTIAR